jgi:hypothetical protein
MRHGAARWAEDPSGETHKWNSGGGHAGPPARRERWRHPDGIRADDAAQALGRDLETLCLGPVPDVSRNQGVAEDVDDRSDPEGAERLRPAQVEVVGH